MILSGADIVVRTLIEQGSEVVFGYPGGQIINVYDSLYKYQDELRHVLTAHEQGATHLYGRFQSLIFHNIHSSLYSSFLCFD